MSTSDIIKDSIAPLVQKILSDPLHFKPAKYPELVANKPSSYIKIGGINSTTDSNTSDSISKELASGKDKEPSQKEMAKEVPKTLAQALQFYTAKRINSYSSDNNKQLKKSKKNQKDSTLEAQETQSYNDEESDDIGEDLASVTDEGQDNGSSSGHVSVESSSEDDDSNYEDANGALNSKTPRHIISAKVFNQFNSEESETSSEKSSAETANDDNDNDDDDDDDDDDVEQVEGDDDEDEEEDNDYVDASSKSDTDSSDDDAEEETSVAGTSTSQIKAIAGQVNEVSDDEDQDLGQLKKDLLDDKDPLTPGTPPTSPDSDEERISSENETKPSNNLLEQFYSFNEVINDRGSNGSKRIVKNWGSTLSELKPQGLLNHGVTCYTNAAVQAMIHIPAVQHYLNDVLAGNYKSTINPRSVSHVLAETSSRMWNFDKFKKGAKFVNPKKLISRLDDINCMMSQWQQEDSHEYFMSLLSRLQEDGTPKGHKLNESIIYDIFGGLLDQSVTCKNCDHVSKTNQEFYDLSLHLGASRKDSNVTNDGDKVTDESSVQLPPDLNEATNQRYSINKSIKDFFSPELIKTDKSDKSGYVCENCKQRTNAIKISSIDRAPETLAIHLKRFRFNGSSSSKVKQGVSYPSILDLSQYTTRNEPVLYQLISVVVHEGRSVSSGHYVAHCRQPDGTWATYDDEYINSITERQALRDPSAYYLIYTRLTHKDIKINQASNNKIIHTNDKVSIKPAFSSINTESSKRPLEAHSRKPSISNHHSNDSHSSTSSPKNRKFKKVSLGGMHPTNNLNNINTSQKRYAKSLNNSSSKRFKKY